jgi:UPF0716 protein FxsA
MILWLFLLFTLIPVIEIAVLIRVGSFIGFWPTIGLMIVMGIVGAWLAKREGRRTLLEIQRALAVGQMPTNEILQGFLIFLGGLLMVTPGFVTDLFGLLLVFPPTRKLSLRVMKRILANKIHFQAMTFGGNHSSSSHQHPMRDVSPTREKSPPSGHTGRLTSL